MLMDRLAPPHAEDADTGAVPTGEEIGEVSEPIRFRSRRYDTAMLPDRQSPDEKRDRVHARHYESGHRWFGYLDLAMLGDGATPAASDAIPGDRGESDRDGTNVPIGSLSRKALNYRFAHAIDTSRVDSLRSARDDDLIDVLRELSSLENHYCSADVRFYCSGRSGLADV